MYAARCDPDAGERVSWGSPRPLTPGLLRQDLGWAGRAASRKDQLEGRKEQRMEFPSLRKISATYLVSFFVSIAHGKYLNI